MKDYPWQRYWHASGDAPPIINGFLYVSEYTKEVFSIDTRLNTPCLILLGEPGMGKSRELRRIGNAETKDEKQKDYINLSSYGDENRLVARIFNSEKIKNWKNNQTDFYLYLDSLDEALININTLASLLADELGELTTQRLFFRIACRTAEWSNLSILENKLRTIWTGDRCQILQIAPLRDADVLEASKIEDINGEKFFGEVFDNNIQPLAAKPVTLRSLLKIYKKGGTFPSAQSQLYERGCLALCGETNESRIASKRTGTLSDEQRLRVAGRIAAVMIFSNKSSVWTAEADIDERADSEISVKELAGYFEIEDDGSEFRITEAEIRETLDTGLFAGNGNNRLKFAHQTFAEFLAAWYLDYRRVLDETIIRLIGAEFLYPQLYETAAWIASRRQSIFRHLMKTAPVVLLRSDVISADDNVKADLVERLLEVFENEEVKDDWLHEYYRKLKHPKLTAQIQPYIIDKSKNWLVRKTAIDIAESCDLIEAQNELADVALDQSEERYTRINAAYAVTRIADSKTKARLKPLIYEENDEYSELKGRGLAATWNENLTAEELFEVLEMPPHNYFGSYSSFINSDLIKKLKVEDLPVALNWISERISIWGGIEYELERLVDEILIKAWENLDREDIFDSFVKLMVKKISGHDRDVFARIFRTAFSTEEDIDKLNEIKKDDENRRKIWLKVFSLIDESLIWSLNASNFIGIGANDIDWLFEQWKKAQDSLIKSRLLLQIQSFASYWGTEPSILSKLYKACEKNENLKKEFKEIFAPVELNSEKAKQQKELFDKNFKRYRRESELEQEEREKPVSPSPLERTLEFLDKFENGETAAFWQINFHLMFLPNGYSERSELELDLTRLPVWEQLDETDILRIIAAAKKYLLEGNPQTEQWIGTDIIYRPAYAGYRAITLLEKFEPKFIKNLEKSVLTGWLPIIYYYPVFAGSESGEYENQRRLIAEIYKIVPNEVIRLFERDMKNGQDDYYQSFGKLEYCWDENLKSILKNKLEDKNTTFSASRQILSQLFNLKDSYAEQYACDLIEFPIPASEESQKLSMLAASLLIAYGKIICWQKIWRILSENVEFGRKFVEFGVTEFGRSRADNLPEKDLANLYIWLSKQYPHSEDPVHHGVYSPGPRDDVIQWRNLLLDTLVGKGTDDAVREIARVRDELPHLDWLKFTLLNARERMREVTWQAFDPKPLLEIIFGINSNITANDRPQTERTSEKKDLEDKIFNDIPVKQNPFLLNLLEDYKNNPDRFAFFTGAGMSAGVFPLWKQVLEKMVQDCFNMRKMSSEERDECGLFLKQGSDYLSIASLCKEKFGTTNYADFLRREFSKRDFNPEQVSAYRQLFKLNPKTVITTNFDFIPNELAGIRSSERSVSAQDYLPKYGIYSNKDVGTAQNDWSDDKPIVFKMHGCISSIDSIVFTQEDFRAIIYANTQIRTFLNAVFTKHTVVFLGFGLTDPHIDSILSFLYEVNKGKGKPHYILMSNLSDIRISFLEKKYEIRVINYISTPGHPQVLEFLQHFET